MLIDVLHLFELFDGRSWPHYGSCISLELFTSAADNSKHVRVLVDGVVARVLPWQDFVGLAQPLAMTAAELEQRCSEGVPERRPVRGLRSRDQQQDKQ